MKHLKSRLLLVAFIWAAAMWVYAVTGVACMNNFSYAPLALTSPWAGIALGCIGGLCIGSLGLRMYCQIRFREEMREISSRKPIAVNVGNDPLVSCQVGHRQPYINVRTVVVR